MNALLPLWVLIGCGMLIATQATVNARLGSSLGLFLFAFIFTVIQLIATAIPLLMTWPQQWGALTQAPWWHYIGGVLGLPILVGMSFAIQRTGTFAGLVALLVGQLAMGMLVDRFGLFNSPVQPISPFRLAGLLVVLLGVWLARL